MRYAFVTIILRQNAKLDVQKMMGHADPTTTLNIYR
jgi:integrase